MASGQRRTKAEPGGYRVMRVSPRKWWIVRETNVPGFVCPVYTTVGAKYRALTFRTEWQANNALLQMGVPVDGRAATGL